MNKKEQFIHYFDLGKFIARTMLDGIFHPDMQLNNVGIKINPIFLDYASVQLISIPEDLTDELFSKLTESLFPLLDSLPNDFTAKSYFRAGFVSYGGILTHGIFANTLNNGFSSFIYTSKNSISATYNEKPIYSDKKNIAAITEWKNYQLDKVSLKNFPSLEIYSNSAERQYISPHNRYYLDNLYFVHSYLGLQDNPSQLPILILNMAMSANRFGLNYTAYGLYQQCLSMNSGITDINALCYQDLSRLNNVSVSSPHIIDYIKEYTCYDLFELLWILNDLDNFTFT